jgi:predicted adenylyl cyclase CyaB
MPVNLEIKIKVLDHDFFTEKLKNIGAEYKGILNQKDIYYNIKNSLLKLRVQNTYTELIKYKRNETGKSRWSNYEILHVSGKNPEKYFNSIFDIETIVIKNRELWLFENTRIHLDVVKSLGKFLELETIVTSDKRDAQKRFNYIIEYLGLNIQNQIRNSYRDLMLKNKKIGLQSLE